MKLVGALTAEWYTLEIREKTEDPMDDETAWVGVGHPVATFKTPEDAMEAATPWNEDGWQCRIAVHRIISTELMRFS